MRRFVFVAALLAGACYSGVATLREQMALLSEWRQASLAERERAVYGPLLPVVANVAAQVPVEDGILLRSGLDPALFPYALFPRKIWQRQTDPETNALYMELPPSPYPRRPAGSFPAAWTLDVQPENLTQGGELVRLQPGGGAP